ncbi:hypothetical protein GCM10011511_04310 [Puia dinghuensis]|uniref:DUF5723 domain-containing protein n=2 Tax=Puia dinghuensis TaxID=1792502 RepID=A0A8J2U7L1_9BACT|nr:hypothetical protein GCM10011511_04310 [Puia dinghuensis]
MTLTALTVTIVCLLSIRTAAQYDMGIVGSNYSGIRGTLINPAAGANLKFKWDVNVLSGDVLFNNTFLYVPKGAVPAFGFKSIIKGIINNDKFATYYDPTQPGKLYHVTLSAEILGPSFQLALPHRQSIGFTFADRLSANVRNIPGATAQNAFVYLKSPPLWDTTFTDGSTKVNGVNWLEYGVHYAKVLFDNGTDQWNAGITVKYLQGIAGAYIRNTHLGYRIVDSTHLLFSGGVDYGRTDYDSYRHVGGFGGVHGHGFGLDIGVQYIHADDTRKEDDYHYKIGLSLLDIGSINFDREAAAFHLQTAGADFSQWGQAHFHSNIAVDRALSAVFYHGDSSRSQVDNGFRMALPAALSLQADWKYMDHYFVNLSIVKGFGQGQGAVQPDIYSIAPRYESKWWDVSVPLSLLYYGVWRPRIGLAVRAGYVFFGGDAPWTLLALSQMKAVDFYVGVRYFVFNKKEK